MKIKAHMVMVLNLDKCLGCHACSIPCQQVWAARPGSEYMYFGHVETRPGTGWPKAWENQSLWRGGWTLHESIPGRLRLKAGGRLSRLAGIFVNPHLPPLTAYGEPWNYDYARLAASPPSRHLPTARLYSAVTRDTLSPQWAAHWEDDLAGAPVTGLDDPNFSGLEAETYLQFQRVFMLHLPRLCGHCLNPACVAACPSGALYKRDEDGIVLADQYRCRSWRLCVSGCPYKKIYFNWQEHHAQKCHLCYPHVESGQAPLCARACTGRIRYMGVMLYDADRVHQMAAKAQAHDLYEAHLSLFLDPHDPEILRQAEADGIPHSFMEAARRSPVRKLICDWKLALPLHPEFRTLPMTWYIPPTSPLLTDNSPRQSRADEHCRQDAADHMRIPLRYLANLFAAGDKTPVRAVLHKLLQVRRHMRAHRLAAHAAGLPVQEGLPAPVPPQPEEAVLSESEALAIGRLLADPSQEERFVIPTTHRENAPGENMQALKAHAGFPGPVTPDPDYNDQGARS